MRLFPALICHNVQTSFDTTGGGPPPHTHTHEHTHTHAHTLGWHMHTHGSSRKKPCTRTPLVHHHSKTLQLRGDISPRRAHEFRRRREDREQLAVKFPNTRGTRRRSSRRRRRRRHHLLPFVSPPPPPPPLPPSSSSSRFQTLSRRSSAADCEAERPLWRLCYRGESADVCSNMQRTPCV